MSEQLSAGSSIFEFISSSPELSAQENYENTGDTLRNAVADVLLAFQQGQSPLRFSIGLDCKNPELPAIVNFGANLRIHLSGTATLEVVCYQKDTDDTPEEDTREILEDYRYEIGSNGQAYRLKGFYKEHDLAARDDYCELRSELRNSKVEGAKKEPPSDEGLSYDEARKHEKTLEKMDKIVDKHATNLKLEKLVGINYTAVSQEEITRLRAFLIDRFDIFIP